MEHFWLGVGEVYVVGWKRGVACVKRGVACEVQSGWVRQGVACVGCTCCVRMS